jgi:(4-(4-[2-(gamma-L-glutamylamino)ethyl]phenoxymethyl)furan-2-yl)methanamine synthase
MAINALGLDIGGANLKACHSTGVASLRPFALWKNVDALGCVLKEFLGQLPDHDVLAVTMTGELCDCFETKREGVQRILDAVESAAAGRPVRVWRTDGRFRDLAAARADPLPTAAANWLALATLAGRMLPVGAGLLIDIGSTTTDIIPLVNGLPVPRGRTDPERLQTRELVYTGVRRTPLCALLGGLAAAEWFATTLDVYLLLGDLAEENRNLDTADGRPATVAAAHGRLARMLCGDSETCSREETCRLAQDVQDRQLRLIRDAVEQVAGLLGEPPRAFILAGSGEFLARRAIDGPPALGGSRLSLAESLGSSISESACAYAVAVLAAEGVDSKGQMEFR